MIFRKKSSKEKKLQISKPILNAYPHHANIIAILNSNPNEMPILFNHYTQLVYNTEIDRLDFSIGMHIPSFIKNYPLIYSHSISRSFVSKKWKSITEFIMECINDGYYVQFIVDTYHIGAYEEFYNRIHFEHNILIYGYNQVEDIFYAADSFVHGKYSFECVSFSELEKSYSKNLPYDWLDGIVLLKVKDDPYTAFWYDVEHIAVEIENYLESEPSAMINIFETGRRNELLHYYGVTVYDKIAEYIQHNRTFNFEYDIRIFYVLLDHKHYLQYMLYELYKVKRVERADYYYNRFRELESDTQKLINAVLKYNVTAEDSILDMIINKLQEIKEKEKEILKEYRLDLTTEPDVNNRFVSGEVLCTSIALEYSEGWSQRNLEDTGYYFTSTDGASAAYQFLGNGIEVYGIKKSTYGFGEVVIDGVSHGTIDFSSKEVLKDELVYKSQKLNYGYHTIQIICADTSQRKKINRINITKMIVKNTEIEKGFTTAEPLKRDRSTSGNWVSLYGTEGFDILGLSTKLPSYVNQAGYLFYNAVLVMLIKTKGDFRALQYREDVKKRFASYYLNPEMFSLDLTISGEEAKRVSFYFMDYDNLGRESKVEIFDADTGELLCTDKIKDFVNGIYLSYEIKGAVQICFTKLEGPDVVLSGVFFE